MRYIPRLITPPKGSFFLISPKGTGKSTWLLHSYPNALRLDLLDRTLERKFLSALWRKNETKAAWYSLYSYGRIFKKLTSRDTSFLMPKNLNLVYTHKIYCTGGNDGYSRNSSKLYD